MEKVELIRSEKKLRIKKIFQDQEIGGNTSERATRGKIDVIIW